MFPLFYKILDNVSTYVGEINSMPKNYLFNGKGIITISKLQFTCSLKPNVPYNCCQIIEVDLNIYCASFLPEPMYISNIV